MTRRFVVHPDVDNDLAGALTRQGRTRSSAKRLVDDYDRALEFVEWFPHGGAHYVDHYRRFNLRSFPWSIGYEVTETEVRVVALLDARRDPAALHSELRQRS